ncbi:MAG: GGDEF domain-containing protein [Pusillimonas sp.]
MDKDLFELEMAALANAQAVAANPALDAQDYRQALHELTQDYRRLMRETHRLIRHGDRTEAELNSVNLKLQQLGSELDYKARHDTLTGTLNRGAVFEEAHRFLQTRHLSLVMLDIDFFKRINDSFGHPAGDAVIRELVERLSEVLQDQGTVGRVGGEEFTILLPDTSLQDSAAIAEAIRHNVASRPFDCLPAHPVTASFGISWSAPGTAFELAYSAADAALYDAKKQGRNRVVY